MNEFNNKKTYKRSRSKNNFNKYHSAVQSKSKRAIEINHIYSRKKISNNIINVFIVFFIVCITFIIIFIAVSIFSRQLLKKEESKSNN